MNAQILSEWLESHPKVERVIYPGLASHPQHALACEQMSGFGGMISVIVKGGLETAKLFLNVVECLHWLRAWVELSHSLNIPES